MRWIGRSIILFLIVGLTTWAFGKLYQFGLLNKYLYNSWISSKYSDLPNEVRATTVYWLESDKWLRFNTTPNAQIVRLLSHVTKKVDEEQRRHSDQVSGDQLTTATITLPHYDYVIEYRWIYANGKTSPINQYHHRTTWLPNRSLSNGKLYPARHYAHQMVVKQSLAQGSRLSAYDPAPISYPSSDQFLFADIPKNESEPIEAIEFRKGAYQLQNQISIDFEVGVRVAQKIAVTTEKATLVWSRLSTQEQKKAFKFHIYPPHLITDYEKLSWLSKRWEPLGPSGVPGEDFTANALYINEAQALPKINLNAKPRGLEIKPNHFLTIPFEGSETPQWELIFSSSKSLNEITSVTNKEIQIDLLLQRNDDLSTDTVTLYPDRLPYRWKITDQPGLLQISSSTPLFLRIEKAVHVADSTLEIIDITPPPNLLTAYPLAPKTLIDKHPILRTTVTESITWRLNAETLPKHTQPLRFDFRMAKLMQTPVGDQLPFWSQMQTHFMNIKAELFDSRDQLISTHRFQLDFSKDGRFDIDPYQQLARPLATQVVSDNPMIPSHISTTPLPHLSRRSLYLRAPAYAAKVKLSSDNPCLVSAYSRGEKQPLIRNLPDEQRPWQSPNQRIPIWFSMRPMQYVDLIVNAQKIYWFHRPMFNQRFDVPYFARHLEPDLHQSSRQKQMLFPYYPVSTPTPTLLPHLYQDLSRLLPAVKHTASKPKRLKITSGSIGTVVNPKLIYLRNKEAPLKLTLMNQLSPQKSEVWDTFTFAGKRGQISLSERIPKPVELSLHSKNPDQSLHGRWFINHLLPLQPIESRAIESRAIESRDIDKPPYYLLRSSHPLNPNGNRYSFKKHSSEERLHIRLFLPPKQSSATIEAKVAWKENVQPLTPRLYQNLTVKHRRYHLKSHRYNTIPMQGAAELWGEPHSFIIKLGEDLPNGDYTLTLHSLNNQSSAEPIHLITTHLGDAFDSVIKQSSERFIEYHDDYD